MNVKIGRDCFVRFVQKASGGLSYIRWWTFSFHEVRFISWLSEQVSPSQVCVPYSLDDGCDKATSCTLGHACPNLDSHYSFRFCRPTWSPILHRGSFNPGNPPEATEAVTLRKTWVLAWLSWGAWLYSILPSRRRVKADSLIACRAHAVPLRV